MPDFFEEQQEFSRKLKGLMNCSEFTLLREKLVSDYREAIKDLIAGENPKARAKIEYISQIIGWFDMGADKEEAIKTLIENNKNDDY